MGKVSSADKMRMQTLHNFTAHGTPTRNSQLLWRAVV